MIKIKKVKGKRLVIAVLAVALAALLLFTACAPREVPTEEKNVVRLGTIMPLTGAAAAPLAIAFRNVVDYLKYFDENGMPGFTLPPGVTIELEWGDSAFESPRAISIYERMKERNILYYYLPSPVEAVALKSRLERDEVPAVVMSVDESLMYPPGWIFAIYPTESERFAVVCDWIIENWQEESPPRVAIMGTDSQSGHASEVMGTKYARSIGIEMLPFEIVPYLPLDVTPQLLRLSEQGADFVYLQTIWSTAIPILKDAERLGLLDKIRFGGMENSQSIAMLERLGPAAEAYFAARANPWYTEVPIVSDIFRMQDENIPRDGADANTLLFYPMQIAAIATAIDNVGFENLNGRAVKEAMYSLKDFDPYGIGTTRTYTPDDHRGAPSLRMYEVRDGEVVPVSDWREAPMLVP